MGNNEPSNLSKVCRYKRASKGAHQSTSGVACPKASRSTRKHTRPTTSVAPKASTSSSSSTAATLPSSSFSTLESRARSCERSALAAGLGARPRQPRPNSGSPCTTRGVRSRANDIRDGSQCRCRPMQLSRSPRYSTNRCPPKRQSTGTPLASTPRQPDAYLRVSELHRWPRRLVAMQCVYPQMRDRNP